MSRFLRFWRECFRITVKTVLHWEGLLGVIFPVVLTLTPLAALYFGYEIEFKNISHRALYTLASILFIARLFLLAPYQVAVARPHLFEPRYNMPVRDAFKHVLLRRHFNEAALVSEDYAEVYRELRQAVVDGDITVWGRKHSGYIIPDSINIPPLEKIEPTYWLTTGIAYLDMLTHQRHSRTDNWDSHSTYLDQRNKYDDLRVDKRQVRLRWKASGVLAKTTRWIAHVAGKTLKSARSA